MKQTTSVTTQQKAAATPWPDVMTDAGDMLKEAASVIRLRTERLSRHALQPDAADLREWQRMSQEKLDAAQASNQAVAGEWQRLQGVMAGPYLQHWLSGAGSLLALCLSATPAQAVARQREWINAMECLATSARQLADGPARLMQTALSPIHAATSANVQRLGGSHAG